MSLERVCFNCVWYSECDHRATSKGICPRHETQDEQAERVRKIIDEEIEEERKRRYSQAIPCGICPNQFDDEDNLAFDELDKE